MWFSINSLYFKYTDVDLTSWHARESVSGVIVWSAGSLLCLAFSHLQSLAVSGELGRFQSRAGKDFHDSKDEDELITLSFKSSFLITR